MKRARGILPIVFEFADDVMSTSGEYARDLSPRLDPDHEQVQKALDELTDAAKKVRRSASIALAEQVKDVMRSIYDEDQHDNATELAEDAADEMEIEEVLEDDDHPIWDWAIEVMDEQQEDED